MGIAIRNSQVPGLATLRKAAGLSQQALGEKIGCGRLAILRWENGQQAPPIKTLHKLADALGCKVEDILREPEQQAS